MSRLRNYLRDLLAVMSEHGSGDPLFAITSIPTVRRKHESKG